MPRKPELITVKGIPWHPDKHGPKSRKRRPPGATTSLNGRRRKPGVDQRLMTEFITSVCRQDAHLENLDML